MPPIKHALLGASKANQWLNCTPSVVWEESFPEEAAGEAAAEGTLAHAIAEEHLQRLLAGKKVTTSKKLRDNPLYKPSMEEYVDTYVTVVMEQLQKCRETTPDAVILLEETVDFSRWVSGGFGTADCLIIADQTLHVFDLKFGKGVPVDAVGNPQIRLYALGALDSYDTLYDIQQVTVHIVQPRLDSISEETLTVKDLMDWAENTVRPRAELAAKGEGVFTPGEHCRWCRCRNICKAYATKQLEIAALVFNEPDHTERNPNELSPAEISDILTRVDELTRWAKGVKDYALEQAVNHGVEFPGYKVVEGRANRIITDEQKAIDLLDNMGYTTDTTTELKGLGALEDLVGKKRLAEILGDLIVKPAGKPVLAPEGDKRPAINSQAEARAVFSDN